VQTVEALAASERARADSLAGRARELAVRADSLARRTARVDTVLRTRIVEVRAQPVPDTCAPWIAERDSLIDAAVAQADSWREAYGQQVLVTGLLEAAQAGLRLANDSLSAVLAGRPRPPPWWRPTLGIGPFTGVCTSGVCAGVGVTLSWRIR
jgi:hypothetical protein